MNLIRPLASAVLLTLVLGSGLALAGNVEIIGPGGDAGIKQGDGLDGGGDAAGTGPADSVPRGEPERNASSNDDSGEGAGYGIFFSPEVDPQPGLQTRHFGALATVSCEVAAHSTDLVVVNQGTEPLPPGTRIKWQLRDQRKRGYFAILGTLGAGKALVADNVLDGNAAPGDVCLARVI